jgi:hypothetical protein
MDNVELVQIKNLLRQKSMEELLSIWTENKRHEWPKGTFDIVKKMLIDGGVKIPKQKTAEDSMTSVDFSKNVGTPFFPTSTTKLAIMSLCTFGIYELFWFYKNWKFLKEKHNFKIRPFWRAWFSVFFCYSFFKIVKKYSKQHQVKADYKPGQLTFVFVLLYVTWQAPDPIWIFSSLTFIPLLSVQKVINNLNTQLFPNFDINSKFSGWNIFGIILGSIWWTLIISGMIFPDTVIHQDY